MLTPHLPVVLDAAWVEERAFSADVPVPNVAGVAGVVSTYCTS